MKRRGQIIPTDLFTGFYGALIGLIVTATAFLETCDPAKIGGVLG